MALNILLAVSAMTVALAEFFFRARSERNKRRLQWTKIIAALVVFVIGTFNAIEPALMKLQADYYYRNGQYPNALALYKKLELDDPEKTELLIKIGQIYKSFAGNTQGAVRNVFLEKSIEYYARISVSNQRAFEPKLAMMSLFSTAGMAKKLTNQFLLLKTQLDQGDYLRNYDGRTLDDKQKSEVHRKLSDFLVEAHDSKLLRPVALSALRFPIGAPELLLIQAMQHLDKSKQLFPDSPGVLVNDSQLSLRLSRLGHSDSKSISFLQRAFDAGLALHNRQTNIRYKKTMSTRLLLKILLDHRISQIDSKGVDIGLIADNLENQTENLPRDDRGYMHEVSANASYLFQAYNKVGNTPKSKKWKTQMIGLKTYLPVKRKKFLCTMYDVLC